MKQPELGRKISELRKLKGLTQEELVEQCNINVRTIQRIEAGEVTPRSFTLKTILNVLDADLENLNACENGISNPTPNHIYLSQFSIKIAWFCGLIYFLSGFVEFAVDYARFYQDDLIISKGSYISMKFIVLLAYVYFLWGFVWVGQIFNNYLLRIGAFFLIGTGILFYGYDIVSLYTEPFYTEYILITQSIFCGIGDMIFGFALWRIAKPKGNLSQITGGFTMAMGVFFILVFMAWLGLIFSIPAILFQIVLLYKIGEFLKIEAHSLSMES